MTSNDWVESGFEDLKHLRAVFHADQFPRFGLPERLPRGRSGEAT